MLEQKKIHPIVALLGAAALLASTPAFAQSGSAPTPAVASSSAPAADAPAADAAPKKADTTIWSLAVKATPIPKTVMILLLFLSFVSWTLLVIKIFEFGGLNKSSDRFLEAFRGARSITDMRRIATSEEFEGNPLADMAAAASEEVELSVRRACRSQGAHRDTTLTRAQSAVSAVQAGLGKRLSGGQSFFATVGSSGPFIGLFGTVVGIMTSFIGITNSHTTNLAVVAPGIAEALLATAIGLLAAIPAVVMYNVFQGSISAYGARSEGFVAELLNAISRQLDKGA